MCTHLYPCLSRPELMLVSPSKLLFWNRVSLWTARMLVQKAWRNLLSLPPKVHTVPKCTWGLGGKFWSACLHSKHFTKSPDCWSDSEFLGEQRMVLADECWELIRFSYWVEYGSCKSRMEAGRLAWSLQWKLIAMEMVRKCQITDTFRSDRTRCCLKHSVGEKLLSFVT